MRRGERATFLWDAVADEAISDNARFRVTVVHENAVGPVQRASTSASSPPFRVRGTSCVWPKLPTISVGNPTPVTGESVRFAGSVAESSGIVTFTWDFGDGTTGQGQVVYHAFQINKPHTVTMTARSEPCPIAKEVLATRSVLVGAGPPKVYLPFVAKSAAPGALITSSLSVSGQTWGNEAGSGSDLSKEGLRLAVERKAAGVLERTRSIWAGVNRLMGATVALAPIGASDLDRVATGEATPMGAPMAVRLGGGIDAQAVLGVVNVTTNTQGVNSQPSVNADGTQIVFWSTAEHGASADNDDGNIELFVAHVDRDLTPRGFEQVTLSTGNILGGFNLAPRFPITGTGTWLSSFSPTGT